MIPSARLVWLLGGGLLLAVGVWLERLLGQDDTFFGALWAWNGMVVFAAGIDAALGWRVRLAATREVTSVLSVGRPNPVTIELASSSPRPLRVEPRDDGADQVIASGLPREIVVPPGGRASWRYHLVPSRRGAHRLGDLFLRVSTPMGLWRRQVRIDAGRSVRVYPDLLAVRTYEKLVREARDEAFTRVVRRRGGESEFERLREFTPDDDVRRIDWRASARRGTLIAREFQLERNQNVVFLLDVGRMMHAESGGLTHLDHALNATLMLGHVAARAGDHVGLAAFDGEVRSFVPPGGGPAASKRLIQATYDLFPSSQESDFRNLCFQLRRRLRKRSLLVLFSQVLDPESARELVPLVRMLTPTHLPLWVLFRDESVESLLERGGPSEEDLFVRGVAAGELLWRERAVEQMRAAGALVLHVRPQELTQQLIGRYLEVKSRQLL